MIHHVYANRTNVRDGLSALGTQQLLGGGEVTEHLCDAPFALEALAVAGPRDLVDGGWTLEGLMAAAGLGEWVLRQGATHAIPDALARLTLQSDRYDVVRGARAANEADAAKVGALQPSGTP